MRAKHFVAITPMKAKSYFHLEVLTTNAIIGTQNINNFIQDSKFLLDPYPACLNCSVHRGFTQTYNDVKDGVMNCAG